MSTQPMQWGDIPNTVEARTAYLKNAGKHISQRPAKSLGWYASPFANDAAYHDRQRLIRLYSAPRIVRWSRALWQSLCGPIAVTVISTALVITLAITITG